MGTSDVQTIQSYGGTIIEFDGWLYSTFLPNPVTSPSQISSSAFAQMDTYASWAETYGIHIIFTFATLSDNTYGGTPTWMLNLVGGNANLLEYDYFTGNSAVSTATTSITCLWQAMATRYASNPYVTFDFFNEPFNGNSYMTQTNYRALESSYATTMTTLIDAVRTISPNQVILVDMPWMGWYDYWNSQATPIDIPRNIIWEIHMYVNPGQDLNLWESVVGWASQVFVTNLGKQLFVGEFGYADGNWMEGPTYSNWQSIISAQVAYMKTLPLWGYQFWAYSNLYGKQTNQQWASQGYSTFTASDSTWILNTVLQP